MVSLTDLPEGFLNGNAWLCVGGSFVQFGEARKSLPKNAYCLENTTN